MKSTTLTLVNVSPTLRPTVLAAAREAFPDVEVRDDDPAVSAGPPPDLLVLAEPDEAATARVLQATNGGGFPRSAVVILGGGAAELAETVPPEDWNPRSLARAFRSARMQHELVCENLRLRGDMKTVARRISHDLRTSVGCIHTSSDLLAELSVGKGAGIANVADIFRQSAAEIAQIIDRMSFLLRASVEPPVRTDVDMGTLVNTVLVQLELEIRRTEAVVIQPDSWPDVTGVAPWLQVVWWNLLHNALKHSGPAPQIRVSWAPEPGGGHRFQVSDRGAGVSTIRQPSLFSPFDQLHGLRSPGLGLSIVQRLVNLHHGRYGYEKLTNGGASFYFTLP